MEQPRIINTEKLSDRKPAKTGQFQTLRTVIVSSTHMMHDTYSGFIAPLIPVLIENLGLLKVQAGLFLLVYQGLAVFQPFIGMAADKKNLRLFALLAPATTGIVLSMLGVAPTLTSGLILCAIGGLSSAVLHATLPPVVTTLSGNEIGKGMSFWMIAGQFGTLLGPILISAMIGTFSIRSLPWLMIPGILISILLNIYLRDISTTNPDQVKSGVKIPFRKIATVMLPIAAVITMRSFLRASSESFIAVYLNEGGGSIWLSGAAISIFKGAGMFGTFISGFINDRVGFRKVFLISLLLSAGAMFGFINTAGVIQITMLALIGIGTMMILPVGMATVQSHFSENRSLANGMYLALLFAINALAGVGTGALYDAFGGYNTFLISAILALFGIPFILLFPKEKTASTKEYIQDL